MNTKIESFRRAAKNLIEELAAFPEYAERRDARGYLADAQAARIAATAALGAAEAVIKALTPPPPPPMHHHRHEAPHPDRPMGNVMVAAHMREPS